MSEYNVILELPARDITKDVADDILDRFSDYHPAVGSSPLGWAEVIITVQGETLRQAIGTALAVAGGPVVSVTGMTTAEYDRRPVGVERLPELMAVTDVAATLGISRTAVQKRIDAGTLPALKVGNGWVVPAAAVR